MTDTASTPAQLAVRLAEAIGRPEDMVAVLSEDVTWWESPSSPVEIMATVTTGRADVLATMQRVFGTVIYNGTTFTTTVHRAISEGDVGVVQFALNGEFANGGKYRNEYTIWAETRGGEIASVWEYVDVACTLAQMRSAGIELPLGELQEVPNASTTMR